MNPVDHHLGRSSRNTQAQYNLIWVGLVVALLTLSGLGIVAGSAVAASSRTLPAWTSELRYTISPPRVHHLGHAIGNESSTNWAGIVVPAPTKTGPILEVYAHWHVPSLTRTCSLKYPNAAVAMWIGMDGWNGSKTIEQAGTTTACNGQGATNVSWAWYEFYPAPPITIPITVNPGDYLGFSITYVETNQTIETSLNGPEFHNWTYDPTAARGSAEFIVEAPSGPWNATGTLPLLHFNPIRFQPLGVIAGAHHSHTKAWNTYNWVNVIMVTPKGAVMAQIATSDPPTNRHIIFAWKSFGP